jgi:hypothetical protein
MTANSAEVVSDSRHNTAGVPKGVPHPPGSKFRTSPIQYCGSNHWSYLIKFWGTVVVALEAIQSLRSSHTVKHTVVADVSITLYGSRTYGQTSP